MRVQTNVYLTAFTHVEEDVFVGPGVITTNDNTMARHGEELPIRGATLRRACRVGGGAVLSYKNNQVSGNATSNSGFTGIASFQ